MTIAAEEIVGRDDALLAVGEFLEGEARALVLEGAAGIGKTVVWLAGTELARRRGHAVLLARPAGTEVTLSLAGLGDLLRGLPERVFERLQAPQRRVLAVALAEDEANGAPLERHMLGIALLNLLRLAAEESPVLVAIDDLQWLDESSGAVILFALRRVDRPNVRLLASCRSETGTEPPLDLEHSLEASSLLRPARAAERGRDPASAA